MFILGSIQLFVMTQIRQIGMILCTIMESPVITFSFNIVLSKNHYDRIRTHTGIYDCH